METIILNLYGLVGAANGGVVRAAQVYARATLAAAEARGWQVVVLANEGFASRMARWLDWDVEVLAYIGWPTDGAMLRRAPVAVVSPLFGMEPFDQEVERWVGIPHLARMPDALALDAPEYGADLARQQVYRALARVTVLVTHSRFSAGRLRAHLGLGEEQIKVIPHRVFLEDAAEGEWPAGVAGPYVLYPANLWTHKRHDLLLDALALIRRERPEVQVVLTGHLEPDALGELLARHEEARQAVVALGVVAEEVLPTLYRGAEAMLFTSAYEGFGMPVLEAFRAGCPVLAARRASLPEVGGEAVLWVEDDTPEGWARAFLRELPERRVALVEQGLARLEMYQHDVAAMFREVLEDFLNKAPSRAEEVEVPVEKVAQEPKEAAPARAARRKTLWNRARHEGMRRLAQRMVDGRPRTLGQLRQHDPSELVLESFPEPSLPAEALPGIGMVTPSFNQAGFLERTMRSVLEQGYPRLSYRVQDGGSGDGSVEVIRKYEERLTSWVSEPDGGQAAAIAAGFRETEGEVMAWLNSDDLLMPGTLRFVGEYFARNPRVDVVYGHRVLIDEDCREIGRWVLPPHDGALLRWVDFVPQETLFWRRGLWEKVGGLDTSFEFALDWDLLLRFQAAGARMRRLPYFLGCFRVHAAQKTQALIGSVGQAEMTRLRKRAAAEPDAEEIMYHFQRGRVLGEVTKWLMQRGWRV